MNLVTVVRSCVECGKRRKVSVVRSRFLCGECRKAAHVPLPDPPRKKVRRGMYELDPPVDGVPTPIQARSKEAARQYVLRLLDRRRMPVGVRIVAYDGRG